MTRRHLIPAALVLALGMAVPVLSQETPAAPPAIAQLKAAADALDPKIATDVDYRVAMLKIDDAEKNARLKTLFFKHVTAVHAWHKDNGAKFAELVPPGVNISTGRKLNNYERMYIADSAIPASVHKDLMDGLKKELTQEQIWAVMDDYTEPGRSPGKILFTMNGYRSIVAMDKQRPQLTPEEEAEIMKNLREAAELSMEMPTRGPGIARNGLVSQVFEVYKTKNEAYLNTHGRDWKAMFSAYVNRSRTPAATPPAGQ